MKKIVLALALAVVTPAVLAAQENGNAYNQNENEVIAQKPQSEPVSITSYGPEGKMLSLSDRALARIRQNRIKKEQEEAQKVQTPQVQEPQKQKAQRPLKQTEATPVKTKSEPVSITSYGPEGKMLSVADRAQERKARNNAQQQQEQEAPVTTYVKEADTVANNHQVVLTNKAANKSAKKRNSSFLRTVRSAGSAIGHALAANAQYEK